MFTPDNSRVPVEDSLEFHVRSAAGSLLAPMWRGCILPAYAIQESRHAKQPMHATEIWI